MTTVPPSLKRIRTVRRYMAAGLLASLFGSAVSTGVLPGAIAIGALPLVWLPVLQTVSTLEEFISPLIARVMRGRDPGAVLVGCEAVDTALCLSALTIIGTTSVDAYIVLIAYLLCSSVLPVVIDVAEELFTGEIARIDPDAALRFNVMIYSLIGFTSAFIARPLGSVLASVAVVAALAINAVLSIGGMALRYRAVRLFPDSTNAKITSASYADERSADDNVQRVGIRRVLTARSPGSPAISALLAVSTALVGGYLLQWAARDTDRPARGVAILMLGMGAGATIGPHAARLLSQNGRDVAAARQILLYRIAVLAAVFLVAATSSSGMWRLGLTLALLTLFEGGVIASVVVQATSRQVRYAGERLGQIVGWSHAASAAGGTLGSWSGLWLSVDRTPLAGIAVAATVSAIAFARVRDEAGAIGPGVEPRSQD